MATIFEGRWICVVQLPLTPGRKTAIYEVITDEGHTCIAEIRWYGPWRKYALFPRANTVWEVTCLSEITTVLHNLMIARKSRGAG